MRSLILACILLSGCQTQMIPEYTPLPVTQPPKAQLMQLRTVTVGVTLDNTDTVYITLTTKEYENLSYNLYELRRYTLQQTETIKYYENLYKK